MSTFNIENIRKGQLIGLIRGTEELQASILEIKENCLLISINSKDEKLVHIGERIYFNIGYGNKLHKCYSKVLGIKLGNNILAALISIPTEAGYTDRRGFSRIQLLQDFKYNFLPEDFASKKLKDVTQEYYQNMNISKTLNMSGGGALIVSDQIAEPGRKLLINFFIQEEIYILGTVIRCDIVNDKILLGICFDDIPSTHNTLLMKFLLEKHTNK